MKNSTLILLFSVLINACYSFAQPANDLCADAVPITCGTTLSGTTTGATYDSIPNCGSATVSVGGVWYMFTGTGDAITVSTCNQTNYDSKIGVYDGTCSTLNCIAGNDDAAGCTGLSSELTFNSVNGTVYYIFVHGYSTSQGDFDITVTCSAPCAPVPANDLCANATSLTVYADTNSCTPTMGTNECSSTNLSNPSCFLFGNVQDVWYSFNTGSVYGVNLAFDTIVGGPFNYALYENCGGTDIQCGFLPGAGITNINNLNSNTDYLLQIFSGGGPDFGSFNLCLSADSTATAPPVPVANDVCDSLIELSVNSTCVFTPASVFGATETMPADSCSGFLSAGALDVWFSFVCTDPTTTVEIDPMFDAVLQVRDQCGTGNNLGCSDWGGITGESVTLSNMLVGYTYYIRVYPWGSFLPVDPNFNICVYTGDFIGIEEVIEENNVKLYPNPTSGELKIDYNEHESGTVQVINSMGATVMNKELSNSIDLSKLDQGLYLVVILNENGDTLLTERVIKQ